MKNHENQPRTMKNHEKPTNVTNFVTHAGSQLTWEGGRAVISKNVTYPRGVTTDLLDV